MCVKTGNVQKRLPSIDRDPIGLATCRAIGRSASSVESLGGGGSKAALHAVLLFSFAVKFAQVCGNFAAFTYHDYFSCCFRAGLRDCFDLGIPGFGQADSLFVRCG